MRNRNPNTRLAVNFVIILILIIIVMGYGFFRFYGFKPLIYFEGFLLKISSPVTRLFRNISYGTGSFFGTLFSLNDIKRRNDDLDLKNRLLRVKLALSENYIQENIRLKDLLDIKKDYKSGLIFAEIVSRDPLSSNNFIINKGSKSKITINNAVICPINLGSVAVVPRVMYQLMGRIKEVFNDNSKVLSILDPDSKISARNIRNNVIGTVEYSTESKKIFLRALKENTDFKKGDIIVTSELSTLPKDLMLGTVSSIEITASIYSKIYIEPSIDFYKMTEIAVVTEK